MADKKPDISVTLELDLHDLEMLSDHSQVYRVRGNFYAALRALGKGKKIMSLIDIDNFVYWLWNKDVEDKRKKDVEDGWKEKLGYKWHGFHFPFAYRGCRTSEAMIYIPNGPTIAVRNSPLLNLDLAKKATIDHAAGKEHYLSDETVGELLIRAQSDDTGERSAIILDRKEDFILEDYDSFMCWTLYKCFCSDTATVGGEIMTLKRGVVRLVPQDYVKSQSRPFVRQFYYPGPVNFWGFPRIGIEEGVDKDLEGCVIDASRRDLHKEANLRGFVMDPVGARYRATHW